MRAFSLNFQQSKWPNQWLGYGLFVLGLVALIYCYVGYSRSADKIANIENEMEQLLHIKPPKPVLADRLQQDAIRLQSEMQHKIYQSLVMPWPALFRALEHSKPEQIRLTEILPDTSTNSIRIAGQANQLVDVLAYVQSLKNEDALRSVGLLGHQVVKLETKTVVNFEIEATWN